MTRRRAVALMVLVTLLWSIAGVVTRHLDAARSFEVTFWRSLFNALALAVGLTVLRGPRLWPGLLRADRVLWASSLCWAVMFTAFMVALTLTTVANVLVTMAIGPMMTALFSRIFLGQRLPLRTWFAILRRRRRHRLDVRRRGRQRRLAARFAGRLRGAAGRRRPTGPCCNGSGESGARRAGHAAGGADRLRDLGAGDAAAGLAAAGLGARPAAAGAARHGPAGAALPAAGPPDARTAGARKLRCWPCSKCCSASPGPGWAPARGFRPAS